MLAIGETQFHQLRPDDGPAPEGLNRDRPRGTFRAMRPGRVLRLLLLALPVVLGLAAGAGHPSPAGSPAVSSVSAPRESLPSPVHNEATCAFCQAAIFPPCAPQPADVSLGEQGLVRLERPAPDTRAPHFNSRRPASSRAPPALRSV